MKIFLVTVKLERDSKHNPAAKVTGQCPASSVPATCTDVTGQHHTILFDTDDDSTTIDDVRTLFDVTGLHVTRIEETSLGSEK